jgi:hypothetical protein
LNFSNVTVGLKSQQAVTLTNSGSATLTISSLNATGAGFSVTGPTLPLNLAPNQSATATVTFAPSAGGQAQGTVTIASNAPNSPASVGVSATGVTYQLAVSPASLGFGSVTAGQNAVLPVCLTNTGTGTLTISQVTATGASFTVTPPALPLMLASGKDSNVSITFSPTASVQYSGTLTIASNAGNSPAVEALIGTGIAAAPKSVDLTWIASISEDVTGYNVYRAASSSGPFAKLNPSLISGTSYEDSPVPAGSYYYVATAVGSAGNESGYSNMAQVTVQ